MFIDVYINTQWYKRPAIIITNLSNGRLLILCVYLFVSVRTFRKMLYDKRTDSYIDIVIHYVSRE